MFLADLAKKARLAAAELEAIPQFTLNAHVAAARGLTIDIDGLARFAEVGSRVILKPNGHMPIKAEIVSFKNGLAQAMAFSPLSGISRGCQAQLMSASNIAVDDSWLGRVIDPLLRPMDGKGPLPIGEVPRPIRTAPPNAGTRERLGERVDLGIKALDTFCTMRRGQRMGLFAASGVGKSTLLSMLTNGADCDVAVLALVGERGRELREFIEDDLGPEGLARSVVICATSDSTPMMRREAAYVAMATAEHFRDQGKQVLLLMDSVTRFALALREIGLAAGEPPATRGYPPSTFSELPQLLERAGPGDQGSTGSITGLFTVLVEGDDHDEPIADAVRGIIDGHVVLDRKIGERGRYPAIDVLRSLSRTVPGCLHTQEANLMRKARSVLSVYQEMGDLIRLGAYRAGSDPAIDEAINLAPRIEDFLGQRKGERYSIEEAFSYLHQALSAHG